MTVNVCLVCYFDGNVNIDPDTRVTSYTDGYCKPLMVKVSCTLKELMDRIYVLNRVSRHLFELHVICKWGFDNGESVTIHVRNDEEAEAILAYDQKHTSIQLYVTKAFKFPTNESDGEDDEDEDEDKREDGDGDEDEDGDMDKSDHWGDWVSDTQDD